MLYQIETKMKLRLFITFLTIFYFFSSCQEAKKEVVYVYSGRHYDVDEVLYRHFEEQFGIQVIVQKGKADELIQRLENEKELAQADLLILAEAGKMGLAKEKNLLEDIENEFKNSKIPAKFRGQDWIALTKRARIFAVLKDQPETHIYQNYADLASPSLINGILSRSSDNGYNRNWIAALIANNSEETITNWAKQVVTNFARQPKGNDRDQMKALANGEGKLAITNSYYVAKLLHSSNPEEVKVGEQMHLIFPDQEGLGTHINISSAGLLKHAKNKKNALLLLNFLTDVFAQEQYTHQNFEFPVHPEASLPETLKNWGSFKENWLSVEEIHQYTPAALRVFEAANWL